MNQSSPHNRTETEKYENINLEEAAGIDFLRENSELILLDCQELITDLAAVGVDKSDLIKLVESIHTKLMSLLKAAQTNQSISDDMVEDIESTYNNLLAVQEEIAEIYTDKMGDLTADETDESHEFRQKTIDNQTSAVSCIAIDKSRVSQKLTVQANNEIASIKINTKDCHSQPKSPVIKPVSKSVEKPVKATPIKKPLLKKTPAPKSIYSPSFAGNKIKQSGVEVADWTNYISQADLLELLGADFSLKTFARHLDNFTSSIESASTDVFERWLGESFANVFDFLKDMTMTEVDSMTSDPQLRQLLKTNNIKYETFVRWLDVYQELKHSIEPTPQTKFGELVCWYVALNLLEKSIHKK